MNHHLEQNVKVYSRRAGIEYYPDKAEARLASVVNLGFNPDSRHTALYVVAHNFLKEHITDRGDLFKEMWLAAGTVYNACYAQAYDVTPPVTPAGQEFVKLLVEQRGAEQKRNSASLPGMIKARLQAEINSR